MKLLIILSVLLCFACGCKLETSSARPNTNANANANANRAVESTDRNEVPQSACSLTADAVPVVEGLKLRATADQVLAILPGSKDDDEVKSGLARPVSPLGVSQFIVHGSHLQPKEKFANIDHFTFGLLDGKVSSINIGYNGPAYAHVDEFVSKFVKGTNLPAVEQWQAYQGLDNQLKILTCKDFEVRVFVGGEGGNQNYVLLTDLDANKTLKERRAKAGAKATPSP
jgi:hypothetical protein